MDERNTQTVENQEQTESVEKEEQTIQAASTSPEEESFKNQFVRVSADFANYKRRVDGERVQWMGSAQRSVIASFLPFIDDIERAVVSLQSDEESDALKGLQLIEKNLKKTFKELGVEEIACNGEFNPELHEALMQADSEDHESGHIVQVLVKGYTYKGDVVRHAKVSVAK